MTQSTLLGCMAGLAMAVTTAIAKVKIKQLTHTEHAGSIAFYFALICSLFGLLTAFLGWKPLNSHTLFWLISAGLFGGVAHIVMTEAMARTSVSTLAVFEYTAIFWALGLDYSVFGGLPDLIELVGVVVIVLAGVGVLKIESRSVRA